MPTGYTAALERMNYDVKKWMKEDVARAFGICISMRDDGKLTEEEIRQKIVEGFSTKYEEDRIKDAEANLAKLQDPNYDFKAELDELKRKEQRRYDERIKEYNTQKEAHVKAMNTIDELGTKLRGSHSELTRNAVTFAKEQLKTAFDFDFSYTPQLSSIMTLSVEDYKREMLEGAKEDLQRYTQKLAEQKKNNADRLAMYDDYINFINKNL